MNAKDDSSPPNSDSSTDFSFLNEASDGPADSAQAPDFTGLTPNDNEDIAVAPTIDVEPNSNAVPITANAEMPTTPSTRSSAKRAARKAEATTPAASKLPVIMGAVSALVIGAFFLWPSENDNTAEEEVVDQGIPFVDPSSEQPGENSNPDNTPDVSQALFGISAEEAKQKKKADKDKPVTDADAKADADGGERGAEDEQ